MTMAAVSFVMFAIAGFVQNAFICLPLGIALTLVVLVVLKKTIGQSVKDITPPSLPRKSSRSRTCNGNPQAAPLQQGAPFFFCSGSLRARPTSMETAKRKQAPAQLRNPQRGRGFPATLRQRAR